MRKSNDNLQKKERIIWEGSPSQIINLGSYIKCLLIFIVIWIIFHLSDLMPRNFKPFPEDYALFQLFYILPVLIASWKWLKVKCIKYKITNERITITQGVFTRTIQEVELYRVKDTITVQPFFLRLFYLGSVILITSDRSTANIIILAVHEAENLRKKLRDLTEIRRDKKGVKEMDFR